MLVKLKQNQITNKEKYGIQEEPIVALTMGYSTQKPLLETLRESCWGKHDLNKK